jgi:hypothetical protein
MICFIFRFLFLFRFLPSGGRNGLVYREASRGWNRLQEEAEAEDFTMGVRFC